MDRLDRSMESTEAALTAQEDKCKKAVHAAQEAATKELTKA